MHTEIRHADETHRPTRTAVREVGAHSDAGALDPGLADVRLIRRLQATAGNAAVAGLLAIQRTPTPDDTWTALGKSLERTPGGSRFYVIAERVTAARLPQAEAVKAVELATTGSGMELGIGPGPEGSVALLPKGIADVTKPVRAVLIEPNGTVSYVQGTLNGPNRELGNIRVLVEGGSVYSGADRKRIASGDIARGEMGESGPKGPGGSDRGSVSGRGVPSGELVQGEMEVTELGGDVPAAEGPIISEGTAAGGVLAIGETEAIVGFALGNLVLPLLLMWYFAASEDEAAEAQRKEIAKALNAAWPQIKAELGKRQGELDNLMKQTKEGQTIYANLGFVIQPQGGSGRGSYDPEPEKPELLYFSGITLSTTRGQRRDGNNLVISIPLYNRQVDAPGAKSRSKMAEGASLSG